MLSDGLNPVNQLFGAKLPSCAWCKVSLHQSGRRVTDRDDYIEAGGCTLIQAEFRHREIVLQAVRSDAHERRDNLAEPVFGPELTCIQRRVIFNANANQQSGELTQQ